MTFSGRFVANIIQFASKQGTGAGELIALTGYNFEELCDESLFVEDHIYNTVTEKALETTNDPFFGLHIGESLNLSAAGLIVQLAQTSRTVKEALHHICEFASLGCRALPFALIEEKDHYKLTLTPSELWLEQSPLSVYHTTDGSIVFTVREFHTLTRNEHAPKAIHLIMNKPENTSEYERIFECPVLFGQPENAILLEKKHVEEPVVTSDYNLLQTLVQHAEMKVAALQSQLGFANMVKQSIVNMVRPEFPTVEQVAAHLNISVRTLQRKLKEEGQTFKGILEDLKKQFALSYIKRADLSVSEIAYLLSYNDASAFIRSFKRWTGKTPNAYRDGI